MGINSETDQYWMQQALALAQAAAQLGEVPVGAVVVANQKIIGKGFNQPIKSQDPTAHAEILALRDASLQLNNYRLPQTTLYVTLEPCTMCIGAMLHARIQRLVFGASEPKAGAVVSHLHLLEQLHFNHRIEWEGGCLADQCSGVLQKFFKLRR